MSKKSKNKNKSRVQGRLSSDKLDKVSGGMVGVHEARAPEHRVLEHAQGRAAFEGHAEHTAPQGSAPLHDGFSDARPPELAEALAHKTSLAGPTRAEAEVKTPASLFEKSKASYEAAKAKRSSDPSEMDKARYALADHVADHAFGVEKYGHPGEMTRQDLRGYLSAAYRENPTLERNMEKTKPGSMQDHEEGALSLISSHFGEYNEVAGKATKERRAKAEEARKAQAAIEPNRDPAKKAAKNAEKYAVAKTEMKGFLDGQLDSLRAKGIGTSKEAISTMLLLRAKEKHINKGHIDQIVEELINDLPEGIIKETVVKPRIPIMPTTKSHEGIGPFLEGLKSNIKENNGFESSQKEWNKTKRAAFGAEYDINPNSWIFPDTRMALTGFKRWLVGPAKSPELKQVLDHYNAYKTIKERLEKKESRKLEGASLQYKAQEDFKEMERGISLHNTVWNEDVEDSDLMKAYDLMYPNKPKA